jgi:hypothetical protein
LDSYQVQTSLSEAMRAARLGRCDGGWWRVHVLVCAAMLLLGALAADGQTGASHAQLPDIRQLMQQVQAHQRELDKLRESYTYSSVETTQDIDANGQVKKTESQEHENFFVNGHVVQRLVKKDGKPLSEHEEQKETERVTKMVEKAERTPPGQPLEGPSISVSRLLEIMDVRNERRVMFRGRAAIVFDFVGRKDAKTHGMAEDASKKLQGTVWIDEADRQVAHLEVSFIDNFHVLGGLFANIQKGSNFRFDQAVVAGDLDRMVGTPESGELWLPTGGEGTIQARVLLVKNMRQHFVERDFDYKRFRVETQQGKDAQAPAKK